MNKYTKALMVMLISLISLPRFSNAQDKSDFILKVKFKKPDSAGTAVLIFNDKKERVIVDLTGDAFELKGKIDRPQYAELFIVKNLASTKVLDVLKFYLDFGQIAINSESSLRVAKITGSAINDENLAYKAFLAPAEHTSSTTLLNYWQSKSPEQRKDSVFLSEYAIRRNNAQKLTDEYKLNYIKAHPNSFFSLVSVEQLSGNYSEMKPLETERLFNLLSPALRKSIAGQKFLNLIADSKKTNIGGTAPAFTHKDAAGKMTSFSSFKGKYVLIDFWASWCIPCRQENPNVLKAYNRFKDRNFTVLGVSLDKADYKQAWLDAIQKDGMPWVQLNDDGSDKIRAAELYGVKAIPSNFLIDPSGIIIAKNLRGNALEEELEKVFTK